MTFRLMSSRQGLPSLPGFASHQFITLPKSVASAQRTTELSLATTFLACISNRVGVHLHQLTALFALPRPSWERVPSSSQWEVRFEQSSVLVIGRDYFAPFKKQQK